MVVDSDPGSDLLLTSYAIGILEPTLYQLGCLAAPVNRGRHIIMDK